MDRKTKVRKDVKDFVMDTAHNDKGWKGLNSFTISDWYNLIADFYISQTKKK